ncbi:MAG: PAS domain-containing sensor histidine kinase [Pseudomonadota bacterium]
MAETGIIVASSNGIAAPRAGRVDWTRVKRTLSRFGIVFVVVLGPALAVATAYLLSDANLDEGRDWLTKTVLLLDICYILVLIALIAWRIGGLLLARRKKSAGTRLHLRLAGVFAAVALIPTIVVAIFAALTLAFGLESLFSDRIGSVVRNSLATAEAYESEHRIDLREDLLNMALDLNRAAVQGANQAQFNDLINKQALIRELPHVYVFNLEKQIIARADYSYLFHFIPPTDEQLEAARRGEVVLIEDAARNEIRALISLNNIGAFLYVSREVQGDVLRLLDETRGTVQFYDRLERERGSVLFTYALIYLGFALFVILGAIVLGLWFAERLARPVGRLAGAAELVGAGNLDVRVKEERGDDEIATLSKAFNHMTGQLKDQRNDLLAARDETDKRRQFIEAVLSGVTAGVIGLDQDGRVDLINDAAAEMLGVGDPQAVGADLADLAPSMARLYEQARTSPGGTARGEIRETMRGETHEFLARIALKSAEDPAEGYVLTFDDITALASAQRMAAWGDVARRIAHEIKNPLTPIQLSTDQIRRKFAPKLEENAASFEQYLDVISRKAGDIGRMVDEFSKFARMPEPKMAPHDLNALIEEAVVLQREARRAITYDVPEAGPRRGVMVDRGLFGQVLTNLLQNAADAIDARTERDGDAAPVPRIAVAVEQSPRSYRLTVMDNGIGLPVDDRDRLTDPYVTTRAKGTGLGLAIVKKIIEQHGGEVTLSDADPDSGLDGAAVTLRIPRPAGSPVETTAGDVAPAEVV